MADGQLVAVNQIQARTLAGKGAVVQKRTNRAESAKKKAPNACNRFA